jgi:hypothetical protein
MASIRLHRLFVWPGFAAAIVLVAAIRLGHGQETPVRVDFTDQVRPILQEHCSECHSGVRRTGGLSFADRHTVIRQGDPDEIPLVPGDPESSQLILRVVSDDPEMRMPPPEEDPAGLSPDDVEILRRWIAQGATWEEHWAFVAPQSQAPPEVKQTDWARESLDRFVLARLEAEQIAPSVAAAPDRWLRRAWLDLTGLPPTLEQRTEFLDDLAARGEAAYPAAVESMLASPRFGERWASVWLDQVRYADSKGLGQDSRRQIWAYRDWVIDAFNRDMPYDQFTIKQIAGDLLPDRTAEDVLATAAHRLTQNNVEGGTDDEEFRVAAVLDRVGTTWQTWQGITFGCAQCHSHPYEPISQREFYRFVAFFNNTADTDTNDDHPLFDAPLDPADYARAGQLDREIEQRREAIWRPQFEMLTDASLWTPLGDLKASTSNATTISVLEVDGHGEFLVGDPIESGASIILDAALPADLRVLSGIRLTALPGDPGKALADSEWGFILSRITAEIAPADGGFPILVPLYRALSDEPEPRYSPEESISGVSRNGFAAYSRINHPRQAAFISAAPIEIPPGARLRVYLDHEVNLQDAFPMVTRRGFVSVTGSPALLDWATDPNLTAQRRELAALADQRREISSTPVPVMRELPEHLARPTHLFERGNYLLKQELVTPGTPASLPPLPEDLPANRLALARWLVNPENPLTARVAVNRFWARVFGVGLVETEEDFGVSGERPSHPELLDDLAHRFQTEMGWSVKRLLREIVLSSTYRQCSKSRPELADRDAQNRLLARGPRVRLPAEAIRDQALAISGLLSDRMFGPPVYPPIPAEIWTPFDAGDRWATLVVGAPDRYRRSIYTYTKRSIPYPMFATFDAPSREFCAPRRLRSNTPLQALVTLNDETFVECTERLAARMDQAEGGAAGQIRHGFLLATGRQPRDEELAPLLTLHENYAAAGNAATGMYLVASALLNLDEVFTK